MGFDVTSPLHAKTGGLFCRAGGGSQMWSGDVVISLWCCMVVSEGQ